jgi:Mce-associated membrane protein
MSRPLTSAAATASNPVVEEAEAQAEPAEVAEPAEATEPSGISDGEVTPARRLRRPWLRRLRPRRPRARRPGPLTVLVVAALVLAGGTGWIGLQVRRHADWNTQSQAAAGVSDTVVRLLWTVDASTSQDVFAALLANSTGSLRSQMSQYAGVFQEVLATQKVSSAGLVVQTGVTSLHGGTASVLVAANATVTDAAGKASVRQYRMRATVTRIDSRWLVSNLEFVA